MDCIRTYPHDVSPVVEALPLHPGPLGGLADRPPLRARTPFLAPTRAALSTTHTNTGPEPAVVRTCDPQPSGPVRAGGAARYTGRHESARVERRPRWSTAAALGGIALLVAVGATVAVRQPVTATAPASQGEGDSPRPLSVAGPLPAPPGVTPSEPAASSPSPAPSPTVRRGERPNHGCHRRRTRHPSPRSRLHPRTARVSCRRPPGVRAVPLVAVHHERPRHRRVGGRAVGDVGG